MEERSGFGSELYKEYKTVEIKMTEGQIKIFSFAEYLRINYGAELFRETPYVS